MKTLLKVLLVFGFLMACEGPALRTEVAQAKTKRKTKKKKKRRAKTVLDSKALKKINLRRARRYDDVTDYKKKSWVGEMENGRLGITKSARMSNKQRKKVEKLLAAENKDREKIYSLVSKSNKYNKAQKKVLRESMFESFLSLDPNGTYYYADQHWRKK